MKSPDSVKKVEVLPLVFLGLRSLFIRSDEGWILVKSRPSEGSIKYADRNENLQVYVRLMHYQSPIIVRQ